MVQQVANVVEKEKDDGFADVALPLPMVETIQDEELDEVHGRKKSMPCRYFFSIILNILLICAVIGLAVRIAHLNKKLGTQEEVEMEPKAMVDHDDDTIDVSASVDKPNHARIRSMQDEYGSDWFRTVRLKLVIVHVDVDDSWWRW